MDGQRRREDARANALLRFSYYAAKLGDRFSRAMFDEFVEHFMSDALSPEIVERRGQELLAILQLHLADVAPPPAADSFEAIAAWHESQSVQLEALPLDKEVKNYCRASLKRRMQDLLTEYLREAAP